MEFLRTEQEKQQTLEANLQNPENTPVDSAVRTIPLVGRLDAVNAPKFENWLRTETDGIEMLILDMKNLEYVSSVGLRVLLQAEKRMSERGGMKVINVSDDVMDVFRATGFTEILTIE
jgi:anti-sigma B factor antagonist